MVSLAQLCRVTGADVVDKKTAISLRMSVSERVVSSNPGVSINVTVLSDISNVAEISTALVHDFKPFPTSRLEPLTKLMNCAMVSLSRMLMSYD